MKAVALYLFAGCIALNVAGNLAANTAKGLEQVQQDRIEKLCQINEAYCS